jgi:predicted transposase/invertase (TIGR01784 family)
MTDNKANKQYKDSVFTKLCEDKKRLIEIYNAVSGKNYPLDTEIEIVTLDDALFLDRQNDVGFVLEGTLIVLIEHQSTVCENMPIRLLIYIARVFEKLFNLDPDFKQAVYKTKLIKIPKPEFFVLYNGKEEFPERKELKLSDAFYETDAQEWLGGSLDLIVPVLNIKEGHNEAILRKSKTLFGYSAFVALVRQYEKSGYTLEKAIEQAVKDCIEKDILAEFLLAHASEVINMLTLEFKMEEAVEVWKEEGREEGIEKVAKNLLLDGVPLGVIVKNTGLPPERIQSLVNP